MATLFSGESRLFPKQSQAASGGQGAGDQYTGQRPGDMPDWQANFEYDAGREVLAPDGNYYRCLIDHNSTGNFATDLGNGFWVIFAGAAIDTDNQVISLDGDGVTLRLSNGLVPDSTVDLTPFLDNTDNQNISLDGDGVTLRLSNGTGADTTVDLSPFLDNTDNQSLTLDGDGVTLRLGNGTGADTTVDLTPFLDNVDNQQISLDGDGVTLRLSNGTGADTTVDLSPFLDADGNGIYDGSGVIPSATVASITDQVDFGTVARLFSNNRFEFGVNAVSADATSVAIGDNANANAPFSIAIGHDTDASVIRSLAMMDSAVSTGGQSIAIGTFSDANSIYDITIGPRASATGVGNTGSAIALGRDALASAQNSIAIGGLSDATALNTISIGSVANAAASRAIALGANADSTGVGSIAISNATATANGDIAIGTNAQAIGQNGAPRTAIAIGKNSVCDNYESTVIGEEAGFNYSGTFGVQAVLIGHRAGRNNTIGNGTVAVGNATIVRQNRGVAIGSVAESDGDGAVALGGYTAATAERSIMIGKGFAAAAKMINNVADSFGIGWSTSSGDQTPDILFAKTVDSYMDIDGNMIIGGTAPTNSKLEVNGDVETLNNTDGFIVLDRIDGNRYRIYTENGVVNTELA